MSEKKSFLDKVPLLKKLKNVKGIEYVVVIVLCIIVLIIYFSTTTDKKDNSNVSIQKTSSFEYAQILEDKLAKVLSQISGAGDVSVMVTIENSSEIVIATSTEERVNTSAGSSNTTQSSTTVTNPIIIDDEPVVIMEKLPTIKGVIVVAQGANDVKVRLNLLTAVQTLIDIDVNKIEILVGK